jgi:glycosyltransferase involved in cell wall biosynthesis
VSPPTIFSSSSFVGVGLQVPNGLRPRTLDHFAFAKQQAVNRQPLVLVAPYSPDETPAHLGAAKKIELVAALLGRLDFELHLVDSSHARCEFSPPIFGESRRMGEQQITLWRPASLPSRKLGKLANVYASGELFARITSVKPAVVWLYNSYAFEARLGLHLRRRANCRLVLELEDLPMARGRGLNPKPYLDEFYFRRLLKSSDLVTFVNDGLRRRFASELIGRSMLFPSIITQDLTAQEPPARFGAPAYTVGYFGGLERDKGAAVLLDLLPILPESWQLNVTGAGSLEADFQAAANLNPGKLKFHGRVSHQRVVELMLQSDAIVNPHASIAEMSDGVFPFKVCEAIASGALVISTTLPSIDVDLSRSVYFYEGGAKGLSAALAMARQHYIENQVEIRRVRDVICSRYGEEAVMRELRAAL